jgi:hypothetical protein|tara:strand:+ start:1169 stop:1390 length:222 start_codon:yes stop_codon:yes gene_type:complete
LCSGKHHRQILFFRIQDIDRISLGDNQAMPSLKRLISIIAYVRSSSYSLNEGISPAMILQKTQSVLNMVEFHL